MAATDCEQSVAPSCEVRWRTRGKTAPSVAGCRSRRSACDIQDDEEQRSRTTQCHLCERALDSDGDGPSSSAPPNKTFKKKRFHGLSWNALRSHRRLHDGSALSDLDRKMVEAPLYWRQEVSPLVVAAPGATRDAGARRSAKQRIVLQTHYDTTEHISDQMLMNKTRYIKWSRLLGDATCDSDASSDFEHLFKRQGGQHASDGERKVAVADNERIRKRHGFATTLQQDLTPRDDMKRGDDDDDSSRRMGGRDGERDGRRRKRDRRRDRDTEPRDGSDEP